MISWWLWRLGSRNRSVRLQAVEQLARAKSPRAVKPLLRVLDRYESDVQLARAVIEALAEIADPAAVRSMLKLMKKRPALADPVTGAITQMGDTAISPLLVYLRKQHQFMPQGCKIMGGIPTAKSVEALRSIRRAARHNADRLFASEALLRITSTLAAAGDGRTVDLIVDAVDQGFGRTAGEIMTRTRATALRRCFQESATGALQRAARLDDPTTTPGRLGESNRNSRATASTSVDYLRRLAGQELKRRGELSQGA